MYSKICSLTIVNAFLKCVFDNKNDFTEKQLKSILLGFSNELLIMKNKTHYY